MKEKYEKVYNELDQWDRIDLKTDLAIINQTYIMGMTIAFFYVLAAITVLTFSLLGLFCFLIAGLFIAFYTYSKYNKEYDKALSKYFEVVRK